MEIKKVNIAYNSIINTKTVIVITIITMTVILGAFYLHPQNVSWISNGNFKWGNFLQFFLFDQILIELVTTLIITYSIKKYGTYFKLSSIDLSTPGIALFTVKFLPVFVTVYFLSAPITTGVRFMYHNYLLTREVSYFDSYFFLNTSLYFAYLIPIFISGILLLALLIFRSIKQSSRKETFKNLTFDVKTNEGSKIISSKDIMSIRKNSSRYIVHLKNEKTYTINKTLAELEELLDVNFMLINRSTIVNLLYFKDYSFWENEKYILRMQNNVEFNITRNRLKLIRERIIMLKNKS